MRSSKYIQIAEPYLGEEEWEALKAPLESGWLTQGPQVKAFEKALAARHQVKFAAAVTSGSTALHLALASVGIGPGDIVIVPSFTWVAVANAVEYLGAAPVFCDSRLDSYNIDPLKLEELLSGLLKRGLKPKAAVAVHLFGLMADMEAIGALAERYGFLIIEDAACAVGATFGGRPAGGYGAVGCFSFHPRKIVTTGEGGMCVTDDENLWERLVSLRNHGASLSRDQRLNPGSPFLMADYDSLGYNYRMSDIQAALGCVQLARLDEMLAHRRHLASLYDRLLSDLEWLVRPAKPDGYGHSYQAYVGRVDSSRQKLPRDEIMRRLHEKGIASRAGTHAIHELGYYRDKYGLRASDYPAAAELYAQSISLPLHNHMSEEDVDRVVNTLKSIERP